VLIPLPVGKTLQVRGNFGEEAGNGTRPARVDWCVELANGHYRAGLQFVAPEEPARAPEQEPEPEARQAEPEFDCYEALQLSPNADLETIHRVYRMLAQRLHPDNTETGNEERFVRISRAYQTLADPERRASYDARHLALRQMQWRIFERGQVLAGPAAERRKRAGVLALLYAKTLENPEGSYLTLLDFENLLGCPREHLQAALWFLRGKGLVTRSDNGRYVMTVEGFEEAERQIEPGLGPERQLTSGE